MASGTIDSNDLIFFENFGGSFTTFSRMPSCGTMARGKFGSFCRNNGEALFMAGTGLAVISVTKASPVLILSISLWNLF